jgi:hypothetical protein
METIQANPTPAEWQAMPPLWWKWFHDVYVLLSGQEGRQNFINVLTATTKNNLNIKSFFINQTNGDARFTDPNANEPYIGPDGDLIVPGTIIASRRQIVNVEAVRAYQTLPQTFFSGVAAMMAFDTEAFDENSSFAASTYTPKQAGKYQVTASIGFLTPVANKSVSLSILKNAGLVSATEQHTSNAVFPIVINTSTLVTMNGTTDFLQVFAQQNFGVNADTIGAEYACYFTAYKVD